MGKIRNEPCSACPYRKDVPSGVWSENEYDKLVAYDAPTGEQPPGPFACHATPEKICSGWAVVHSNRGHGKELLALRIFAPDEPIPTPKTELFASGAEAAEHGKRDIEDPSDEAIEMAQRLFRKYERLQVE